MMKKGQVGKKNRHSGSVINLKKNSLQILEICWKLWIVSQLYAAVPPKFCRIEGINPYTDTFLLGKNVV